MGLTKLLPFLSGKDKVKPQEPPKLPVEGSPEWHAWLRAKNERVFEHRRIEETKQ